MDAAFRSLDEPFAVEIVSLPPAKLAKLEKFKREKEANLALAEAVTQGGRFGRVYSSLRSTISLIEELSASINLPPEAHNREVELAERKYNQQAGRAERLIDRLRGNPNLREIRAQAIKQAKARISATKRRLLKDRLIALKDHSLCKIPAEQLEALTFPERSLEPFLHLRSLVVSDSEPTDEQIDELIVLFRIWGFDWEELEEIKEKTEKDLKYIEEEMPAGSAPFPSSHITRDFQGIAYYLGVLIDQSQTGSNPTRKTTENLVSLIRGLIRFKCW